MSIAVRSAPAALLLILAAATALPGCQRCGERGAPTAGPAAEQHAAPAARAAASPDTWFRVELLAGNDRVPFFLGVESTGDRGHLDSGEERLEVVVVGRDPLVVRIPVRGVELSLEPDGGSGRFKGTLRGKYFFKRDFDLLAERVDAPRPELLFPGTEPPAADLSGTWRVEIEEFGVGRGWFRQTPDGAIGGSLIPPEIGDMRHLIGRVVGDRLLLSGFNGTAGLLIEATVAEGGARLDGRWLVAGLGSFGLVATRDGAPELHTLTSLRLRAGADRVTVPQLTEPPFRGQPVIIDYFGTWCPACIDLAPELVRLHREHGPAGLQVLSIALEPAEDEAEKAAARRRIEEYRAEFGVSWPIDLRFTDDLPSHLPPELDNVAGFPVSIWIRRDGTVAALHTGFVSRAVPDEHLATLRQFENWTREIMESPAPAAPD
jgi:thiol-disulfide isomerase/thioredoxin